MTKVEDLIGRVLTDIIKDDDTIIFICGSGDRYKMYHRQDCCEGVYIDDINGDLQDLIGCPILQAEQVSNTDFEVQYRKKILSDPWAPDSYTWTFYKFATIKGYVTVRWFGQSNGYYSEGVDFMLLGVDSEW
jgi:hypothetical protein